MTPAQIRERDEREARWRALLANAPKPVLKDDALYLVDNGACYCGRHCGSSARYTGRDISGQKVHRVTEADQRYAAANGFAFACETCSPIAERDAKS